MKRRKKASVCIFRQKKAAEEEMAIMKIHVLENRKEEFATALGILGRKSPIQVSYGSDLLPGVMNLGFSRPEDFSGQESAALLEKWENGYIIKGTRLFCELSELLYVVSCLEDGMEPETGLKPAVFKRYFQCYDDCSFAFARSADDFDLELHMLEMVRMGVESVDINRLYDDVPIQVKERSVYDDKYQWWSIYSAGLDMYYESPLTRGTYPPSVLRHNREVLLETVRVARALGMKSLFTTFEPRAWPERLLRRYPDLRGARVDHPAYSSEPEYAADVNHPLVRRHYANLMEQLMQDVPDLEMIEIWSQDSCAGFPWGEALYASANGPIWKRKMPIWVSVNHLLGALKEAAEKVNPNTRVHINLSWVFRPEEKKEILDHLLPGLGVSAAFWEWDHALGFSALKDAQQRGIENIQLIQEGVGCKWKQYAPLVGFPYPRNVFRDLCAWQASGIENISMRGGIVPSIFAPKCINSEVIREFQHRGKNLDLDALLSRYAHAWTDDETQAAALLRAWDLCGELDAAYNRFGMCWTAPMFVSSRTLFRRMVQPLVPDPSKLTFEESRFFKPYMFLTLATDPSWYDHSYFSFEQKTSDEKMEMSIKLLEETLIPLMEETIRVLEDIDHPVINDLRDRVKCFLYISNTERDLMDIQVNIHCYKQQPDEAYRAIIRQDMEHDIETTEKFIELLQNTKSVLIPCTSGEETTYMFKAPLWPTLQQKIKAMKKHFDDLPGPYFEEDMYYLGDFDQ